MSIKSTFSIKDLENLSGVKAHTIRIWEERYELLQPERTKTNIRQYNIVNLQKILSVALLNNYGIKVSKIASLSDEEIKDKILEIENETDSFSQNINLLKLTMLKFDRAAFDEIFEQMLEQHSFQDVFLKVFSRLLNEIGLLWMTKTICSVHEKFISNLIRQKLIGRIEEMEVVQNCDRHTFVLFLPLNEIHELGLMYVHYELIANGHQSIFLGPSVPTKDLLEIQKVYEDITFISYFTIKPTLGTADKFLNNFSETILKPRKQKLHLLGRMTKELSSIDDFDNIFKYENILDLVGQF